MNSAESREKLYKYIDGDGKYNIGTFDYFNEAMGPLDTPKTKPITPSSPDTETKPKEYPQPTDAAGNPITNNGQPYSQEVLAQYYSADNKGGNFRDLATIAGAMEQKNQAAPAPVVKQPAYGDFGFTGKNPSPLQPAEEKPYKMPLMFKPEQQADNNQWAKTQAQAEYNMASPTGPNAARNTFQSMQQAGEAETARLMNRKAFDTKNFDTFFKEHVSPVFGEEKTAAEQRVQEFTERGKDNTGGLLARLAGKIRRSYAQEKFNDPQKVANTTLQRVQDDSSFGDYLLSRMGIDGMSTSGEDDSPQLSDREKEWMKKLFAKETQEVSDQITQRLYNDYQSQGAPSSVLDYIGGKAFNENLAAQLYKAIIQRAAGSSGLREQLRAMAYDEYGKDQSWLTRVAGGAAPFAVDALSGAFTLPNYIGQAVVKGGMKLAAQEVAKQMEKRAAARGLEGAAAKAAATGGEEIAQRYIATQAPILNIAMNTAGSAANFATYETQAEIARQITSGEFKPIDIMKEAVHGALLGSAMGAAGGFIGRASRNASTLGKVGAGAAGIGAETGIFALSTGLQKAMQDGVDIEDVDWADTAGEAFGTVIGMKSVGAVMHPRTFLNRYRKSKDYDLQLNQHDLDELKAAGYSFDDVFKGLGKFGEISPMKSTTISKAKEYTPGPEGTATKKETTAEESWVDADAYEAIMRNPEISTSAKRKLVYVATGKVLAPEPVFGVTMDTDKNGKPSITTLNAYGAPIETKDYKNEQEAEDVYKNIQDAARANTIGGLERIAEKAGHPEVVDEAKGRTREETGIDVDNLEQLGELNEEDASKILDTYVKNLQEAYMQRFNEDLQRIGEAAIRNEGRTVTPPPTTGNDSEGAPVSRSERRNAAYQKGMGVSQDDTSLYSIGHDNRVAEARMMQYLPDGSNTEAVRKNIIQAVEAGDLDAAEQIFANAAPRLNATQIDAIENYLDAAQTQLGIDDAITEQVAAFEQRQRQKLQNIADQQGNITELQMKDGSIVYLLAGDLNNHYGSIMVTDGNDNNQQRLVRDVVQIGQPRSVDDVLTDNVNDYAAGIQLLYNDYANGSIFRNGQQVDMMIAGQPVRAIKTGNDANGNPVFTMEDGSQITLSLQEAQESVMAADNAAIQQQLQQEAETARLAEQQQRFVTGIKGYNEGQPDLSAAESDAQVAAEYLLSETMGDDKLRKQRITYIDNTRQQLQQSSDEAKRELLQLNQWLAGNEDIAPPEEVAETKAKIEQLNTAIADVDNRMDKWGEIRRNLMTPEERTEMEQQRRREIFNARTGYEPQVSQTARRTNADGIVEEDGKANFGLTSVGNANNYLLRNFDDAYQAEQFINGERVKLRNVQRDEIQPAMNVRNDILNAYATGKVDLTSDELKQITHEVADLEAQQDMLSQQAIRLREIAEGIQDLYERNKRNETLSPEEQRAKELDKAGSKEDKLRIARTLYNNYPEALDRINDQEPRNLEEFIAANLGLGSMNWEGYDQGGRHLIGVQEAVFGKRGATRGIGKGYATNAFNHYLAPTGEGKDFNTIVHGLYESLPDVGDGKQWSTEDISNALINMLLTVQKPSDISHRIINNRIAEAEDIVQHQEEYEREMEEQAKMEEMQQWADAYHLTPEEREEFEEFMKMAPTEPEQEIINNIIADEQDSRSNGLDSQSANQPVGGEDQGGEGEVRGQGSSEEIAGNKNQQSPERAEDGDGVEAVSDTDVSEGAQERIAEIQEIVDNHQKKYRTLAPVEVLSIDSDDDMRKIAGDEYEEARQYLKEAKLLCVYAPDLKKILIFAENIGNDDIEEGLFHESIHRGLEQYYGDNIRELVEDFWETESKENPEKSKEGKRKVSEMYADQPDHIKEEYFTHLMGLHMKKGSVDKILDRLSPEYQEVVNNILTNIGYDRAEETAARKPAENKLEGNAGEARTEESQLGGGVDNSFSARLAKAIAETNTNPTEAQKQAGNYRKPELKFGGYTFRIENPKGSTRSGVDANGKKWSQEMHDTYGYIEEKTGKDGDKMDFFINDDADLDNWNGRVYVIDQKKEDGTFDEHKVMYGYPTLRAAREAYKRNYEDGWYDKHVMAIMGVKKADFDKWLADSDHKIKPFSEYFRTKILKDAVRDDVDQLMADVEERKAKEPEVVSQYTNEQLSKMDITTLSQLIKKAQKDAATSRYLLGTTNIQPGSDKEHILKRNIAQAEKDVEALTSAQNELKAKIQKSIEDAEAGGAIVDHLQDIGIDVSTDPKENRKIHKKGESDNSEEGKLKHMRTPDGKVYGFTYRGKMYLDPRMMDAERPLHEYGHLWGEAFRRLNPEGWKNVVDTMKQDADTWNFVKQMNPDLTSDDDIAEEMIAKGTGEKGKQRVREEFDRMAQRDPSYKGKWNNIWKNISKAIQDFWKQVGDFLNIKYKSAEQVYDQVLKDFANGVNPRKKVEDWLKQRDAEYTEAVKNGNTEKATQIFNEALKENVGNGMTPFVAVDKYRKMSRLAHKVKDGDAAAIEKAAELMAPLVPENAVLIPTPSRSGKATTMLQLANAIAQRTGSEVADILESSPRASQYEIKKQGGKAITAKDMGIFVNGPIPEGKVPVVIDNVVDTGNTAEACIKALGTGIVASLADSTEIGRRVASLRSAAPIIANREGELVPLSQRFDLSRKETARPVDIDNLMDEVENRIDTAGRVEVEAAIESDKTEAGVKAVNTAVRDRATKAVVKIVSDTGVPIKQVSREEADQMMQLFTMMNRQAIVDFARNQRPSEIKRYAVINVRDPFAVPKYFEKRQYAQEYKVWGNQGKGLYDLLDLGYDDTTEQNTELKEAADIMPMVGWHGSAAVFTKFDHSHIGEGAGSQSFGWGTYLSGSKKIGSDYARMLNRGWTYQGKHLDDIEAIHDGKNHKSGAIRDILSAMNHGDRLKDAKERSIRFIKSAIRDYEEEIQHLSEEDKQDLNDMREILSYIESLKMEDFKKDPENLYKVEIPEDTGDNYLPYIETIKKSNRRKIADVVRNLEGEPRKSFVYANYKNGWNSLADMIEREQWAYKEVEDRLLHALGGRLADAKKVSELMSKAGFVGVKYPAGTIFGGGEGVTNYVIFNEDDAKIVEHIQFMFDNSPQTEQPIFYSNAMKAVEAIKQDKATPEQWIAMIQKNGGLKAGEDKWIGLSDWLTEQKKAGKSVTKQEVMDYIRQNQIQIEEVPYREYFNMDDNPKMKEFRKEFDDLREKYYDEANKAWRDTENFNQEMNAKYGYGWANKLDEADQKRSDEITERYKKYVNESPSTLAFQEMVDKYGDDFEQGFYVDYGSDTLEPNSDMYDEGISDAAKHFLELNDQPINDTRLNYTTAGLDNKREIAITVPTIEPYNANDEIHFGDAGEGRAVVWVRFGDTTVPIKEDVVKHADEFEAPYDNGRGNTLYYPKGTKPGWSKDYIVHGKDKDGKDFYRVVIAEATIGVYDNFEEAQKNMNLYFQNHPKQQTTGTQKVLVIDEIQSKRHQDAREKGYSNANDIPKKHGWTIIDDPYNPKIFNSNGDRLTRNPDMVGQKDGDHTFVLATEDEWRDISEYFTRKRRGIPDAPFEKNWHEVAMKRMLRYAAEHGYDKVAWTTGAQQAERYSLSNIVKSIEVGNWGEDVNGDKLEVEQGYKGKSNWVPENDVEKAIKDYIEYCMENGDTFSMSVAYAYNQITDAPNESKGWTYDAVLKVADAIEADLTGYKDARGVVINVGDDLIGMSVNRDGKILDSSTTYFVGKSLADVVGKEVALMIVGKEGKGKVDAGDLAIGGEGMKGFYDDILPRFMNKYGKKWGVKVEDINLPGIGDPFEGAVMHSIDVTPEMKESVMQGQPMFQKERDGRVYGWTDGQGIFLTPDGMNPNTPIHEYTHIWDKYIQKNDPVLWKEMVKTFKKTDIWRQIRENPNYRSIWNDDDKMASEVHSRLSGESGEQMFTAAAADETKDTSSIIKEVKRVLKKFWDAIARLFKLGKIKDDRLQEFVNMPLRDLLRKVNPVGGDRLPVEPMPEMSDEKTLMGVHNISEEKLKKAIKQGGLANPSMAVIDTKNGIHTDYGEISLIPRSSLIDAKSGRNAGTYAGDAWTPTYPGVTKEMTKKGDEHKKQIAKEAAGGNAELEEHLARTMERYVEDNENRLHLLYLIQKGIKPELLPETTIHTHEEYEELRKILGNDRLQYSSDGLSKEQNDAILEMMLKGAREKAEVVSKPIKDEEQRKKAVEAMVNMRRNSLVDENGRLWFAKYDSYIYDVLRDEKRRQNPKIDWYKTDNEADYRVAKEKLAEDYETWKQQLFNDEDIDEKLFAGWTPDGNKRYVKNTLANASRLMNKEDETNAYGNGGLSASKAKLVKKLKTLAEIRQNQHLIKTGDDVKEQLKEKEDEWFSIIQEVSDMKKIDDNRFINIDIAEARLQEAMEKRDPIAYLNKEYGYHIDKDGDLASRLMNFMEEASELPVKYFETKFRRPVALSEFAIAVVPETTSPEVIEALENAGLEVHAYEKGNHGDENDENRKAAVMNAVKPRTDILFHIGDVGEAKIVRMNRLNQYGLDENNPIGRKLTEMKKKSGKNALLGYIDSDFSGYVFLGDDARTISSIKPKYKVYDDNGMPAVYVNTKDFDSLSPLLVAKGYMMGLVDPSVIEEEPESLTETEQPAHPEIKSWRQGELFTDADFMEPEPHTKAEAEVKEPEVAQTKESPDLTQIRLRKLDEGEECHVERVYEEEKIFTFTGANRIESLDDVAYIFRQLQNASVENTFVVLEKGGVPTIIHLAMGGFTSSPVPAVNAFAAYSELKPDNVYFIHNHPSGRLVCSKQDQDVYRELVGIFGSKLREGIIINTTSGKYGIFNSNRDFGTEQIPANVEKEVPMKVYTFSKQVFAKDWNPETAFRGNTALSVAKFVSSHRLGQHKKMSLLVMDQAMHITGNVFLPWTKLSDAVSRDNAQLIATYVTQMGGNCCALYGNYGYDQNDEIAVKDFQLMLGTRNIKLLDLVNMEGDSSYYRSMQEQGVMESGAMAEGFVSETGDALGGVKVKSVTYNQATDAEKKEIEKGNKGFYDPNTGEVTLLTDNISDAEDAKRTVFHEKLGHEGLVALLGNQGEVNKFGHFIYKSASKGLKQRIIEKADINDPDWTDPLRFSHAAQEVIADIAENGPRTADEFSLWDKIKHYIIRFCNRIGLKIRGLLNDHDLAYYILKTGEALKTWNGMSAEAKAEAAKQGYDTMYSRGRGKPRKRNNESMAQYLQRLREWERWKIAEEQARANNDPLPTVDEINNKWEEKYQRDLAEWKQRNGITGETPEIGEFPKRRNGETPQEYAARVADYETQVDIYKEAPSLFDYLQQANDEYREAYKAWRERYGIQEAENVDLGLYEGDPDSLPHIVEPEDLEADNRADAELAEAVGIDMSAEGAKRHTKLAVIERRKNLESANAEDAIWIYNMVKRIDEEAKRQGVTPKELKSKMADIIEGTYFEDVIKDEHGNVITIEDISDRLPIKLTPELKEILSDIKDWYDYFYHQLEDAGLRNDAGYIEEGYVNHVWSKEKTNPEIWKKYIENFQRTKSPNMRERIFDTYRAGEDVGLVRKFDDISNILAYYSSSNNQAIANRKFLDALSFVVVEELNSDGEVVSVLPLLNSSKPNAMVSDRYDIYKVPGVGDVWVIKDIQRTFSNIFGTMRTKDVADWVSEFGRAYDIVSSTAKKIQLSFSAFHMGALTEVAMAQMRPDRAARALAQYIIFDCAKKGTIPAYAHPEDFKFAASHLVQLGATQDYSAADVNNLTEKFRDVVRELANDENLAKKGTGYAVTPVAAALDYINKGMDKVLWNYLHDGLKIACFKMFAEQIEKRVVKEALTPEQREQLLDEAGQYVNDTFGGQYWELLNVSPSTVKWLRRAFLSPDWLISTQRHFLANFGFGSLYSESGFLNYLRYNADNIKRVFGVDVPKDENRRFRSSNAKKCYILGVCGFFYVMMNALNAFFRAQDEEKEKAKADEIRKTNPDYKSGYELAYPDGMKWYDYTMYGNTVGQQTHLFLGRYDDGTEWYARWGKQFREFPELFMGRHGVEFPTPLMERMSGKANPVGRYLLYDLPLTVGMYGYRQPRETQEIAEKYGNTVALLAMTAKKFLPFPVPTQDDKEFKLFDLVMPSQKGFTQWKAKDYFETYILAGDMDGVMRTYNAAAMNNLDAEAALKAAITTIKATQRKELADGVIDLQTAMDRFDAAKDSKERKLMKSKIIKYLAEQNYKAFTREEAREQVETFLSGEQLTDNEINKYVELQTSSDVRDDYRLSLVKKQAKKFVDEIKTAEGDRQKKLAYNYQPWIQIHAIIKQSDSAINKLKKQLGKGNNDAELMKQIRDIRTQTQKKVDEVEAPK